MKKNFVRISGNAVMRTAQGYLCANDGVNGASGACGSACGAASDEKPQEPKPAACGSACGAGEK